jgi:hypothetical protein
VRSLSVFRFSNQSLLCISRLSHARYIPASLEALTLITRKCSIFWVA